MIVLIVTVSYGAYRYSKWLRRDKPHPGGGGMSDPNLPNHNPDKEK